MRVSRPFCNEETVNFLDVCRFVKCVKNKTPLVAFLMLNLNFGSFVSKDVG